MSSFFTLPASQKKRKRPQAADRDDGPRSIKSKGRATRDESISGSEDSGDDDDLPVGGDDLSQSDEEDEEEFAHEDPATKRIRLAEQYLANTQKEVLEKVGFDAADVDQENLRRRLGDRLKEDTAESHGRLYRWIADDYSWNHAEQRIVRMDGKGINAVAAQGQFIYTAGKDMSITKWEVPQSQIAEANGDNTSSKKPQRRGYTRGAAKSKFDRDYDQHTGAILCLEASQDGKFLASGGADNKLIVWDAATLKSLKVFTQHRDSVTSIAFRRGTNQLYSASKDRTVKVWSLDELAYVETLFGHQDEVVDVSALGQEKCITAGARDRTARLWKVVEESQLVFRGGGAPSKPRRTGADDEEPLDLSLYAYNEGSTDRAACIDDDTFLTASDNGSISLWNVNKKKPVFTHPLAHGLEPALPLSALSAEANPDPEQVFQAPQPRWITALRAIPYSNIFVTGSWDGFVRVWRLSTDKRRIEPLGPLECVDSEGMVTSRRVEGVINDLAILDRGDRGKDGVLVVAGVGKAPRLGRWKDVVGAKNGMAVFNIPRKTLVESEDGESEAGEKNGDFEGFEG